MKFRVNDAVALDKSRVVALHLALSGLRIGEEYRRVIGNDMDRVMIVLAVAAITAERLARSQAQGAYDDLRRALPETEVAPCNVTSVAAATGLPRETARRKVATLVKDGVLCRLVTGGGLALAEDAKQQPEVFAMLRRLAGEIARLASALTDAGVIQPIEERALPAPVSEAA